TEPHHTQERYVLSKSAVPNLVLRICSATMAALKSSSSVVAGTTVGIGLEVVNLEHSVRIAVRILLMTNRTRHGGALGTLSRKPCPATSTGAKYCFPARNARLMYHWRS